MIGDAVGTPHSLQGFPKALPGRPHLSENRSGVPLLLGQAQEKVLGGDIVVLERVRLLGGRVNEVLQVFADVRIEDRAKSSGNLSGSICACIS